MEVYTLLVLCLAHQLAPAAGSRPVTSSGSLRKLFLLTLFPYPDLRGNRALQPSYDAGRDLLPAAEVAAELINNRTDVLPGYELVLVNGDGGCEITSKGLVSFVSEVIHAKTAEHITGIIGPGCSASTQAVSPLSARLPLINIHIGGSPLLANRTIYPYSFGMLGSAKAFADSVFGLMRVNGWKQLVALYDQSRLFFYTAFLDIERRIKFEIPDGNLYSFVVGESYFPLADIKEPAEDVFPRVVVVLTGPEFARRIMCLAYHSGLLYPTYQWLIIARYFPDFGGVSFKYDGREYNCSRGIMSNTILEGNLLVNYQLSTQQQNKTFSGVTYEEYWQLYNVRRTEVYKRLGQTPDEEPDIYATTVYDAVWAMALALNNSNTNLEAYVYGEKNSTDDIRREVHLLDFEGVSGHVEFDPATGFSMRLITVDQVFNGVPKTVAYGDRQSIYFSDDSSPVFIDDTFPENPITVKLPLAIFFYFVFGAELVVTVALHVVTLIYRKAPSVKASSIRLNQLVFLGCYLLSLGAFLYVTIKAFPLPDKQLGWVCHAFWAWVTPLGYTFIVTSVIARMWRLYRIFIHYLNPGPLISDPVLFGFVGALVLVYGIIAALWTAIDPIQVEIIARDTVDGREGQTLELELDRLCVSDSSLWIGLSFGFGCLLFIAMVTLALLTRNIHNPNFSTTSIRVFSYLLFLLLIPGFPTYFLLLYLYININIDFTVLCVIWMSTLLLCVVLIVVPPIAPSLKEKIRTL